MHPDVEFSGRKPIKVGAHDDSNSTAEARTELLLATVGEVSVDGTISRDAIRSFQVPSARLHLGTVMDHSMGHHSMSHRQF